MPSRYEWMAGIVDGEGSIGAYQYGTGLRLQLAVSMAHEPTIRRLKRIAGCGTICVRHPDGVHHKKTQWKLAVYGQQAADVLRLLKPHLFTKKSQAALLIRLADSMVMGVNRLTPTVRARRVRLITQLREEK